MEEQIQAWENEIRRLTSQFQASFGSLSAEAFNFKPSPEEWSIAQIIDHLIRINESYFQLIRSIRQGSYRPPFIARISFIPLALGKLIHASVKPENQKKTKTFPNWEPAQSFFELSLLDRFQQQQEELIHQIRQAKDLLAQGTIISSPANKYIVYSLSTAFEIMISHEERHLLQAQAILNYLTENKQAFI